MRSLPDTRSRRLSDAKLRVPKLKRLKNGFAAQQVTTRSQAKTTPKKKLGQSTFRAKVLNNAKEARRRKSVTAGGASTNGVIRRGLCMGSPGRRSGERESPKGQDAMLRFHMSNGHSEKSSGVQLHNKSQNCYYNGAMLEREKKRQNIATQRAEAAQRRAERLKKRRSALWVLNCEAESFVYGEPGTEGQDAEVSPMSTPPKKRRRMRPNEPGCVLKESPILGAKLRSPTKSPSLSPFKEVGEHGEGNRKVFAPSPSRIPSSLVETLGNSHQHDVNELAPILIPVPSCNSMSPGTPLKHSSDCSKSNSVRMKSILSSMKWRFSFEELPSDETWYSTFKRQEVSRNSLSAFECPKGEPNYSSPVLLPYETKVMNHRSPAKRKLPRLPRKSPRCHASTLAILSSLKQRGRHRHSAMLPQPNFTSGLTVSLPPMSPTSSISSPASPSEEPRVKRVYTKRAVPGPSATDLYPPSPVRTPTLPPVSPPQLSCFPNVFHSPSPVSPPSSPNRIRDLSATQYLWDSIQLLSDPYVIQILAGDRPKSPLPSPKANLFPCQNNVDVDTQSNISSSSSSRKVKNCVTPILNNKKNCQQLTNSFLEAARTLNLEPNNKLSSKCNVNPNNKSPCNLKPAFRNEPLLSFKFESSKAKRLNVNGKNLHNCMGDKPPNGVSSSGRYRKSNRKSPVVLVADIFKNPRSTSGSDSNQTPSPQASPTSSPSSVNNNCKTGNEDVLFLMEGIPPLPAWPV